MKYFHPQLFPPSTSFINENTFSLIKQNEVSDSEQNKQNKKESEQYKEESEQYKEEYEQNKESDQYKEESESELDFDEKIIKDILSSLSHLIDKIIEIKEIIPKISIDKTSFSQEIDSPKFIN